MVLPGTQELNKGKALQVQLAMCNTTGIPVDVSIARVLQRHFTMGQLLSNTLA